MLHTLSLAIPVLLVVIGLLWGIGVAAGRAGAAEVRGTIARPRPRVSAQQLGLGHRLAARALRSRSRPQDSAFQLLEDYTRDVDAGAIAFATPGWTWVRSAAQAAEPLLALEQLLESLEKFTARARAWRPGRHRERS